MKECEKTINWNRVKTDTFILVSNDNESWERALLLFMKMVRFMRGIMVNVLLHVLVLKC